MTPDDLHEEMCAALEAFGGVRCEALLPPEPGKRLADIVLRSKGVIIEVKTLTADRNKTPSVREKAGAIVDRWAAAGVGQRRSGYYKAPLASFPRPVAEELLRNLGRGVKDSLKEANNQIKATARRLEIDAACGIVTFVVPSHFSTDAGALATIAGRVLRPGTHSAINAAMVIEVPFDGHADPKRMAGILPMSRLTMPAVPYGIYELIGYSWSAHFAKRTGGAVHVLPGSEDDFERLYLVPERKPDP